MQYLYQNLGVTTQGGYYTTLNLEESVKCSTGGANLRKLLFTCRFLVTSKIKNKWIVIQAVHNLVRVNFEGFRYVRKHNSFIVIKHEGITY